MSALEAQQASGFDKLARAYRWIEYISFGPVLQHCRVHFLPVVGDLRRALLLGDGDGRFCAALLAAEPQVHVTAVDESARMLQALCARVERGGNGSRVTAVHADATEALPEGTVDLICTHFFLDCLSEDEVDALAAELRLRCPRGHWVISEFAVPTGPAGWLSRVIVGALYLSFGVLTGLRTRRLPDYPSSLRRHSFVCMAVHTRLFGLLRSELWQSGLGEDDKLCAPVVHPRLRRDNMAAEDPSRETDGVESPEMWPSTYPPQGENAELPWLPTDPIPNTEPEAPGLGMPDPALYKA